MEDHDKYDDLNKYYGEFFPKNPPARTTLGVAQVPGDSRLEITCIAHADLAERKAIGQPPMGRPYSPGVLAGDTLYISGKGDQNSDGSHPGTFEEQARQCMRNVEATLKEAGLDFRHVVMSHLFVDNPANLRQARDIHAEHFKDVAPPALASAIVDWIPGGSHIEITCIATTDLTSRRGVRPPTFSQRTSSPGMWAGNTLYLSGIIGLEMGKLSAGVEEQTHQLGHNHARILEAAGLAPEDIVSGLVYLTHMDDYQAMNGVYREHFSKGPGVRTTLMPGNRPANSTIRVSASFIAAKTESAKE